LNSLMRWIKPHEQIFFDLLEASSGNVLAAARHFDAEVRSEDPSRWADLRRQMNIFEHKGDDCTSSILERMDTTFVTPIEREDLLALAHALDDVVDHLDVVTERLVLYRIGTLRPSLLEISSELVEGCALLDQLVRQLRVMPKITEVRPLCRDIHDLENRVDAIYHAALAEIFHDGLSAVDLMKWKELLDIVETAMDRVEQAARVVSSTVMKNS
jgi:hypothetical protein